MLRDHPTIFSDDQSMAINIGNTDSANGLQLVTGKDPFGNVKYADVNSDNEIVVLAAVGDTAIVAAGDSAVLTIEVYEHTTDSSFASGNLLASKAITIGTAGKAVGTTLAELRIPRSEIDEEYIGINYKVETQNLSSGTIDTALVDHVEAKSPRG